jgi:RNA polymerase sigma-70 factor (ECF subfamily)
MDRSEHDVTGLLQRWGSGDESVLGELVGLIYSQLHHLASGYLAAERSSHTLQSTALVNEAFLKLVLSKVSPKDRGHFFALASRAMRQILVDHARSRQRHKRGGGVLRITLNEATLVSPQFEPSLIDLDEALTKLALRDERKSKIVEMLYFGGMTYEEASMALEIAPVTLHRELSLAKAWLARQLRAGGVGKSVSD